MNNVVNGLVSFRDVADHYGVGLDVIHEWIKLKHLVAFKDDFGVIKITYPSICVFDEVYSKICPNWKSRAAMHNILRSIELKYYIVDNIVTETINGNIIYRIRSLIDFTTITGKFIKKGDIGGWVESSHNLSQYGVCWIDHNAEIYDDARIMDSAYIGNSACIYGHTIIRGNTKLMNCAETTDFSLIENTTIDNNNYIAGIETIISTVT